jgi:hypothetical protein
MSKKQLIVFLFLLVAACTSGNGNPLSEPIDTDIPPTAVASTSTVVSTFAPTEATPLSSSTPEPLPSTMTYGPDEFPAGYNPLTGQPVSDPARLEYPALLLSISHFPPEARPQAGFSFMPFVYEYYITEGSTRHVGVVYGEFPEPEIPLYGHCEVRAEPMTQTKMVLGNLVWHDTNENGRQDPREGGIGGICVNLLDENRMLLQQTTTDSNGYYGFNVQSGRYILEIERPEWLKFTEGNGGDERFDSDIDPAAGRTDIIDISDSSLLLGDAGLVPSSDVTPTPNPEATLPPAEVGPIRSGRIFYRFMGAMYQDSCLIYAGADPAVQVHIPRCATVAHTDVGGGAMLALERMARISEQIKRASTNFNYTGHLFSEEAPPGGEPVRELREYWALLNQSKWTYDAASESWWRYVDESDPDAAGELHPNTDRLTGRQLQFENMILMFAEHTVITPTIIDINLAIGNQGDAYLFRDGNRYKIKWSTVATEYQRKTGRGQPMRFLNPDGTPAALKPGKTWVIIYTLDSYLQDVAPEIFRARFVPPLGAKLE